MKYEVAIIDQINGEITTGTIYGDALDGQHPELFIGEIVTVQTHDENGNVLQARGELSEVLEEA